MSSRGATRESLSVPRDKSRRGSMSTPRQKKKSKKKKETDADDISPPQAQDLTKDGKGEPEKEEHREIEEQPKNVEEEKTATEENKFEGESLAISRPQSAVSDVVRRREIDEIDERIDMYREKYKSRQDLAVQWKKDVEDKRALILEKYQKLKSLQSKKIDNFLEKSGLRKLLAFGKGNEMGESGCNTEGDSHDAEMTREPEKSNIQIIIEPSEDVSEIKDASEGPAEGGKKQRRRKSISKEGRKESRRHRRRGSVRSGTGDEDGPAVPQLGNTPTITPTKGP